ncbi:MAG: hypothetical protein L0215_10275 [Gemmataceae bacterium]|nr:hypothetical protein [Gemmataceae bacterium]
MAKKRSRRKQSCPKNITLCDSAGRIRVLLGVFGESEHTTFQLWDAEQRARVSIQIEPDGRALFNLLEPSGQGLVNLGASPEGVGISVYRPGGRPLLSMNWDSAEGLKLNVWDESGNDLWQGFDPFRTSRNSSATPSHTLENNSTSPESPHENS